MSRYSWLRFADLYSIVNPSFPRFAFFFDTCFYLPAHQQLFANHNAGSFCAERKQAELACIRSCYTLFDIHFTFSKQIYAII